MMGASGADDVVGVLLRQIFKQLRFQMIDDNYMYNRRYPNVGIAISVSI